MKNLGTSALLAYERGLAALAISTVVEATPHIGRPPSRTFVASVLVGSVRRDLVAADAHRLSTFGALSSLGIDSVSEMIETLVARGFLESLESRRGIICTAAGRALLESLGVEGPGLGLVRGAVEAETLDVAVRAGLVEALRRYRSEQAFQLEVPEYRLISEATLREIAVNLPKTTEELAAVSGIGPKSLDTYGAEILRLVAEHLPIIERLRAAQTGAAR